MRSHVTFGSFVMIAAFCATPAMAAPPAPTLEGRAVLPAVSLAPGPPSGAAVTSANGVSFPLPAQPVTGFSALLTGREPGEYLGMPDNGFGGKGNSRDFLIRAYYITPDFKTARGGSGTVAVGDYIEFRDPDQLIGFPIVHEGTAERLLTGGDIDPESLQRDLHGDYWMGEEFGPWILHFDAAGKLLDPPFALAGIRSPNNPFLAGQPPTHPNSRGFEGMGQSVNGKYLYAALEGPTLADTDKHRRSIFEFSIEDKAYTGRQWQYRTEQPGYLIADIWGLDNHRLAVLERDLGLGLTAEFRNVYVVDLRQVGADGFVQKTLKVELARLADPDLVSLPPIHEGDVGLGNPFRVTCESIEAVYAPSADTLVLGCDSNLPNKGRNPALADDQEFIVVKVPGLKFLTVD